MANVLNVLYEISFFAALIVLCLLLLRSVAKKRMSAQLQYMLWGLLVLRLLLPVQIDTGLHLASILPRPAAVEQITTTATQPGNAQLGNTPSTGQNQNHTPIQNDNTATPPVTGQPVSPQQPQQIAPAGK